MENVLVTGGLGFIGLHLLSKLSEDGNMFIHNVDYNSLDENYFEAFLNKEQKSKIKNYINDINEKEVIRHILQEYNIRKVYHLAAESHVDRSIEASKIFFESNVMGTLSLVECCRDYIEKNKIKNFRFLHVSTDEVFGDLGPDDEPFNEETPYNPSSPYSVSKASSDMIIKAWWRTYNFPAIITNCSNNFGPCQNKEKFIPTVITKILNGEKVPVYGDGMNVRDWLYVEDHVCTLVSLVNSVLTKEQLCVGGRNEYTNIDLIKKIMSILELEAKIKIDTESSLLFVKDRKGHDRRYSVSINKLQKHLGTVSSKESFYKNLLKTVLFYKNEINF